MPVALIALAAIGTAATIYGQISAANAQAEAQQREIELKKIQANEMLERQAINEQIMRDKEAWLENHAGSDNGTSGSSLVGIMRYRKDLAQNIATSRREAEFKAGMLKMGAEADAKLASDTMTAGYISGAGTLLTGAANVGYQYSQAKSPSAPPSNKVASLPGVA